ncbi:glycosyltransferase family 2 protein [Nanoarchaeota archaeon]
MKTPIRVSIIIPTYNEEKDISEAIASLLKQSFKDFEIIIVDDGSIDNTLQIIKNFSKKDKRVKIIPGKHKGPGFSRNLGAKKAKGKILVFVDADMTFDKDYIKNLIAPLTKNKQIIGSTHELEMVKNTKNIWSRCWGKIRFDKESAKDARIFRAINKNKFFDMGGFDSKYGYADDQTFWFKYGKRPFAAKKTSCYHKNPETLKSVYKQSKWIGASIENFWLKVPIVKYLVPLVMLIFFPLAVPILGLKKSIKNKDFKLFFPWMLIFMTVRYFGTISGIFREIYLGRNIR